MSCPRCHREHTGLCGIPPRMISSPSAKRSTQEPFAVSARKPSPNVVREKSIPFILELALDAARKELDEATALIRSLNESDPGYNDAFNRLENALNWVSKLKTGE